MKKIFTACCLLFLAGCSYQPAINAFETTALKSAEAANDNILAVNTVAICSMPYRTFLRHPETWSYINLMCAPGVKEVSPKDLLKVPDITTTNLAPAK